MAVEPTSLPFEAQVAFFRQKVNLPTRAWTDIWEGMHSRAFVVAGAMKQDLLTDLRTAVQGAIENGHTLDQFRKEFDQVVAKHGWAYNGGRNWRTRVIYDTNLRSSYSAARYQQLQAVKKVRPFWKYVHASGETHPRPQHLAWDGMVLHADDPFWDSHYPPNGWNCRCRVFPIDHKQLSDLGKAGPDKAPEVKMRQATVGTRGPSPRTVMVPEGIDPGFGYNPGKTAWGKPVSEQVMAEAKAAPGGAWKRLTPGSWQEYNRPKQIPRDTPKARIGPRLKDVAEMHQALHHLLGGEDKAFKVAGMPVLVNAETLATHLDPARSEYLPLLPELLSDPFEAWLAFEQHKETGQVAMRTRIVKAFNAGKDRSGKDRTLLFVANAHKGALESWTMIPTSDDQYINKQRVGKMIYGR
jgi:hypothetical protein